MEGRMSTFCHQKYYARTVLSVLALFVACFLLEDRMLLGGVEAFVTRSSPQYIVMDWKSPKQQRTASALILSMASQRAVISVPSQSQCESLGVREWPQQSKSGSWAESVSPDKAVARYVLEGNGSVTIEEIGEPQQPIFIRPGTLIEIQEGAQSVQLEWSCDKDCSEIIILTPGFEEGNVFLGVVAGILVLFGVLLSGALG